MPKALSEMTIEELWRLFPIVLKEYNPDYKKWYEEEKERIAETAGEALFRLSHVGSTAVEGLMAKPIVDILLEVGAACSMEDLKQRLVSDGWICMSEQYEPRERLSFNKGYTEAGFARKVYHLHLRRAGDNRELYFRDYLYSHPDTAHSYEELKKELKEKYEFNRDAYTAAKTEFVERYTREAVKEFGGRYNQENALFC